LRSQARLLPLLLRPRQAVGAASPQRRAQQVPQPPRVLLAAPRTTFFAATPPTIFHSTASLREAGPMITTTGVPTGFWDGSHELMRTKAGVATADRKLAWAAAIQARVTVK